MDFDPISVFIGCAGGMLLGGGIGYRSGYNRGIAEGQAHTKEILEKYTKEMLEVRETIKSEAMHQRKEIAKLFE